MAEINNVIMFPVTKCDRQPTDLPKPVANLPAVIDFEARRRTASAKLRAAADDALSGTLTPGEVWDALNEDRLVMHYQPQYDLRTGKMISAEALIRLLDHDGELIYPDQFIDIMEHGDLVVPLGRTVIEQVCADLADWRAKGYSIQRVAINLSARQINIDTTLLSFIDQVLEHYQLDYSDLEFELTERQSLVSQSGALAVLNELAERGTRIVIDDFGIGYSSIVYLAELPVSALKIDRAMVDRLPEDTAMQSLVESLILLADKLDLDVIAEGIETRAQNEYLVRAGCPVAQGFAYAKPMGTSALQEFMANEAVASRQNSLRF